MQRIESTRYCHELLMKNTQLRQNLQSITQRQAPQTYSVTKS